MADPDLQMSLEVDRAIRRFAEINNAEGLSEHDKNLLKEEYLRNYFTPHAQEMLRVKLERQRAREAPLNELRGRRSPGSHHRQQ